MFATELGGGGNVNPHMAQLARDGVVTGHALPEYAGTINRDTNAG